MAEWDARLSTVFNRGFWTAITWGSAWANGVRATGRVLPSARCTSGGGVKYFSRLGVAEFLVEAEEIAPGDSLLVVGPTTGVVRVVPAEIHGDNGPVAHAEKGMRVAIAVPAKVRPSDKLYKLVAAGR